MVIRFTQTCDYAGNRLINVGAPVAATDAATKTYVDASIQGLSWKVAARAASTADIDLSAPGATIDGVALANGDRFLVKDQTDASENGIYVFNGAAAAATRAPDADSDTDLGAGTALSVVEGTVNADQAFLLITDGPIDLDTDDLTFTVLAGGAPPVYVGGAGMTITGTTFDVGAGTGITVAADTVGIDTAVVVRKFAADLGDGVATSFPIVHNLNTRDVSVDVYLNSGTYDTVFAEVQRTDVNTVTVLFGAAPAAAEYRVVIHG